jgi:hypothetical protein
LTIAFDKADEADLSVARRVLEVSADGTPAPVEQA